MNIIYKGNKKMKKEILDEIDFANVFVKITNTPEGKMRVAPVARWRPPDLMNCCNWQRGISKAR